MDRALPCALLLLLPSLCASVVSELPRGVGFYIRKESRNINVPLNIRNLATRGVSEALAAGVKKLEVDFPPLLPLKTPLDDFDQAEVFDANRDFAMQFATSFAGKDTWLCYPDLKELCLAKEAWPGGSYRQVTLTTIEAAARVVSGEEPKKAWGTAFARAVVGSGLVSQDLIGDPAEEDLLGGGRAEDPEANPPRLQIICQPGDYGPVEDWENVELCGSGEEGAVCVINGALQNLRGGYYSPLFYPSLAKSVDRYYRDFEPAYLLRPINSEGWLHRVYGEDFGLFKEVGSGKEPKLVAEMPERPSFEDCIRILRTSSA